MSGGFELQPLDGGPRVALPPGETVIGRGPLLGVTDKRVSRRHAVLEVVGGQLRIKPIHTNPCFYQSSGMTQLSPMKMNIWRWLNSGDSFSLLVDKYIFRVFSVHSETELECTLRNSQMLDEGEILDETSNPPSLDLPKKTSTPRLEESTEIASIPTMTTNSVSVVEKCGDFNQQLSNLTQRKRILPAWMLADGLSDQSLSAPVISAALRGYQQLVSGPILIQYDCIFTNYFRKRRTKDGLVHNSLLQDHFWPKFRMDLLFRLQVLLTLQRILAEEVPQSLSAPTLSDAEVNHLKTDTQENKIPIQELDEISEQSSVTKGTPNKMHEAVSSSESCLSAAGNSSHDEPQGSPPKLASDPSKPETSHAKSSVSVSQGSEEDKAKRTSCVYGAKCYRKNPVHFQHFSHPGDSDYGDVPVMKEDDEADDRPECPYGTLCYRKNPQHKIEYKHSAPPGRSTLDEDDGNTGPPNEYDPNDSFIDDEEEEYEPTDEDSDWEPGKEDQEKEDVEELLKEAKKFMKRKK
ncbi:aprataxin and PNK-like factor [Echinops telfairi]|uniref:Aprataxin and PNK-like factor n=1 Tax=Echinops telfairi TaxID=9371 RepID=A0AC55DE56_ECHTE|nr:aprataxin and PNK-like factor [Echinops telfairi]